MIKKTILVLALFVLALVAINLFDEKLDPQVEAILKKVPESSLAGDQANAYLVSLRDSNGMVWESTGHLPSRENKTLTEYLTQNPEVMKTVEDHRTKIDEYLKLLEFGDYTPQVEMQPSTWIPAQNLIFGHKWLELDNGRELLNKKWLLVEGRIARENQLYARLIKKSNLLTSMLSMVILDHNLDLLLEMKKENPRFKPKTTTLETFRIPPTQEFFASAYEQELKTVAFLVHDQQALAMPEAGIPQAFAFLLKPNATLNEFQRRYRENDQNPPRPWQMLYNSTGKWLAHLYVQNTVSRRPKAEAREKSMAEKLARLR